MADPGIVAIRIVRGDTIFHVHGDRAGEEGVWLAAGQVDGIYDAPVSTTWKTGAFQTGSWQKARKWLHRDMELGFHIRDTFTEYELNESLFRQIFDYQLDPWEVDPVPTTIEVETHISGVRKLDVLMYEAPNFKSDLDPMINQYGNLILKLRAGQPFWYQDDLVSEFSDTVTAQTGTVTASNPTDQVAYQKWVLTRGTWTLPDFSWTGGRGERTPGGPYHDRTISGIVVTAGNGGAVADLDRQELMFRDANDSNILGQLAGKFFNYAIPPYCPPTTLPVAYTGAPTGGAMVQLRIPQCWSRPWGLELPSTDYLVRAPYITTYTTPTYRYVVPDWCDAVDAVLLGAGGGGGMGLGGAAGEWETVTLVRGDDIPWETTVITGTVGAGGQGRGAVSGGNGGTTTAVAAGMTTLTGTGGAGSGNSVQAGEAAGPEIFNTVTYPGGGAATKPSQPGPIPGSGGAGGWRTTSIGGTGARGQVWFRAYQVES